MTYPTARAKKRKTPFAREIDADLENLRDDCIALFINSRMTQQQIHAAGGPTPSTISKWLYKETKFPRYQTIQAFLKVLGYQLSVVNIGFDGGRAAVNHARAKPIRLPPKRKHRHA